MVFESVYTKEIDMRVSIHDPEDAYRLVKDLIEDSRQEKCFVITMDTNKNVIGVHIINIGKAHTVMFSMKDIFYHTIVDNASRIIIFHNHPFGSVTPSENDITSAQDMYKAGTIMGIIVQDVMIVSEKGYTSIKPSFDLVKKGEITLT